MNTLHSKQNILDKAAVETSKTASLSHPARKTVYVGMSGGVDSSVSAYLLKQQGYDVTGVFIKAWQPDNTDCGWKDERRDAMRVAVVLDIPFLTLDFSEQYKREVVDYMIEEYRLGRTPNPDVMCNRHVKFGSFLQYTLSQNVNYVATGHYAQNILSVENCEKVGVNFEMKEGADANKDQTYFLWTLTQNDLKHVLFPIGHLQKSEVRKIAEKAGLPVFDKKDSQGVCFIGHLDMKAFLKEYIQTQPGNVLDTQGNVIGRHDGAVLYTIGERHGFAFNTKTTENEPHFVISKDIEKNTITVATKSENSDASTQKNTARITKVSFSQDIESYIGKRVDTQHNNSTGDKKIYARIRYRQEKQYCVISKSSKNGVTNNIADNTADKNNTEYIVTFDTPQKGMAEGQSVVLYDGNTCLGGGILNYI